MHRELDAAGIGDPRLRASYRACRRTNAAHGRTFYLATLLLPAAKRPYVHALYAFARHADDIVDRPPGGPATAADRLAAWGAAFLDADDGGGGDDAILPAVRDTVTRWEIPHALFETFLASMRMDLTVTGYPTYADLLDYMEGSAAAIGLQMLPILEPLPGMAAVAATYARDLGIAFQLTNFVRDVGEDLRRGRVYLPEEDLRRFGLTRADLAGGVVDGRVRRLLAHQIARARELYRAAVPGIRLLHPTSRDCVAAAARLYGGILDAVERADYDVLDRRVAVGVPRRAAVAVPAAVRAARARRVSARLVSARPAPRPPSSR